MYSTQQRQRPSSQYTQPDQPYLQNDSQTDSPYSSVRSRAASQQPIPQTNGEDVEFDDIDDEREYTPPQDQDTDPDDFYNGDNDNSHPPSTYMPDQYAPRSVATQSIRAPSPPPGPLLDHSHLRPGNQAALLSHERTLELYRANAKKTQDPDLQFEFAVFMIDASKSLPIPENIPGNLLQVEKAMEKREDLVKEATGLLKRLADRGHSPSQYFLADCFANGIGTVKEAGFRPSISSICSRCEAWPCRCGLSCRDVLRKRLGMQTGISKGGDFFPESCSGIAPWRDVSVGYRRAQRGARLITESEGRCQMAKEERGASYGRVSSCFARVGVATRAGN